MARSSEWMVASISALPAKAKADDLSRDLAKAIVNKAEANLSWPSIVKACGMSEAKAASLVTLAKARAAKAEKAGEKAAIAIIAENAAKAKAEGKPAAKAASKPAAKAKAASKPAAKATDFLAEDAAKDAITPEWAKALQDAMQACVDNVSELRADVAAIKATQTVYAKRLVAVEKAAKATAGKA